MLTPKQIELRKKGIGGSEIAALMGLNKFDTPLFIYRRKLGLDPELEENKYMRAGHKLEPVVKEYFTEETGYKLTSLPIFKKCGTVVKGVQVITPDGIYLNNNDELGVLECKNTRYPMDEPEDSWICQPQWYAGGLGINHITIAWLESGFDFKYRELEFNKDLYEYMINIATEFWNNHIKKRIPPEPVNSSDINTLWPKHKQGECIEVQEEVYNEFLRLKELKQNSKALQQDIDNIEENLKLCFRSAENLVYEGKTIATYKTPKETETLDRELLLKEKPDIYREYLITKQNGRKLHLKNN